ncbi:MAG: 2-C-methyl-D-erythritol 2,4-cyclodiphosphate synthase [Bacteroidota bacterium]|nr:2-C-methyl-D-erythritol 2,4-cyclodiphosphate synthase [Bacteroidota bacterium]
MGIRIGFGYDVHELQEGYDVWLGGIKINHYKGAKGHSDADVLIHAICDALLGAADLRDIGFHFPDTSSDFKGIDSKILLKKVIHLISDKGFKIGNIDTTICLQKPKISEYIELMKLTLADTMSISEDKISIKGKTTEKLGFIGREEGISAYAVALLEFNTLP